VRILADCIAVCMGNLMVFLLSCCSVASKQQIWSVLDLGGERADGELISKCHYLVSSPSTTEYDGDMSMLEEVTCCCFIPELGEWDFTAPSPTAALTAWNQGSRIRPNLTDVSASTLLVSGTTSNTVYVHTNGILLVSYVLPAPPAEMYVGLVYSPCVNLECLTRIFQFQMVHV
jgi:hypothetical protein